MLEIIGVSFVIPRQSTRGSKLAHLCLSFVLKPFLPGTLPQISSLISWFQKTHTWFSLHLQYTGKHDQPTQGMLKPGGMTSNLQVEQAGELSQRIWGFSNGESPSINSLPKWLSSNCILSLNHIFIILHHATDWGTLLIVLLHPKLHGKLKINKVVIRILATHRKTSITSLATCWCVLKLS